MRWTALAAEQRLGRGTHRGHFRAGESPQILDDFMDQTHRVTLAAAGLKQRSATYRCVLRQALMWVKHRDPAACRPGCAGIGRPGESVLRFRAQDVTAAGSFRPSR
jgi:hypothetical protein